MRQLLFEWEEEEKKKKNTRLDLQNFLFARVWLDRLIECVNQRGNSFA